MLERERHRLILKLVEERSVVSVGDLVDLLDASEATIRRDIIALADRGELKRVRGGAEALRPRHTPHLVGVPFVVNLETAIAEKRAIARAAARLVEPDDSVIINGGTTTLRLVEFLAGLDLDILTNSFPIAADLLVKARSRITLPGGTVYPEQNIILSPFEEADAIDHFAGRIMFTGCYGVGRLGWMETDPLVIQSERRLLKRAERLVVMADARKLRARSAMVVTPLERVDVLVTDSSAREEDLAIVREAGIEVVIAEVLPEDRALETAA
ncbi:DeoR/GlpR family DNA-binding transcription regulator [Segnochrobactrum spirostomi]|uniref:DeoR/GlpR transcriptional regulator n=1 Tax=Segnochrobactrum spirostomi TaxID=2608987 RepID=A0A6A7Y110_9HYPH|nr:DeoR/GlpR family DNA-binding transcription regulator [Segnochrobactrum spirostomi]MQT12593.1 DeoR/GlpR transcriptional regulator [Segnochrobactrum spirostomi]